MTFKKGKDHDIQEQVSITEIPTMARFYSALLHKEILRDLHY